MSNIRAAARRIAFSALPALLMAMASTACTSVKDVTEPSCTYGVTPSSASFGSAGGSGTLAVQATGVCGWSVTNPPAWVTFLSETKGNGDGTVRYTVAPNASTAARSGSFTIGDRTYTLSQSGACAVTIAPTSASFSSPGGSGSITVTAGAECGWTGTSSVDWITLTGPTSGSGPGAIGYAVAANPDTGTRSASVLVAGHSLFVSQSGIAPPPAPAPACTFSVAPTSASVVAAGGTGTLTVATTSGCAWNAASTVTWMRITAGSTGSGAGTTTYMVDPNTTTVARAGTVTIAGQTVTVTQAGSTAPGPGPTCSYAVAPLTASAEALGTTGTLTVTTAGSCAWTATSAVPWLTITSGATGSGSGAVAYTVAANATGAARTGTLLVAGQTVTVTQAASSPTCSYTVSPTSATFDDKKRDGTIQITTAAGCAWSASTSTSWLTLRNPTSGTGSGTLTYTVDAYNSTTPRSGTITVAGEVVTITQQK